MQSLAPLLLCIAASLLCKRATGQCQPLEDSTLQARRLQSLRNNILAQLDLTEPLVPTPDVNATTTTSPPQTPQDMAVVESFHALQMASNDLDREKEQKCHSDEFYAKPVTSFVGIMSEEGKLCIHTVQRWWLAKLTCGVYNCKAVSLGSS